MLIALIPSNQEANEFAGIPGDYDEEDNWVTAAQEAVAEAKRQGAKAEMFWRDALVGENNVPKLVAMLDDAQRAGATHYLSYHSNVSHRNADSTWKAQVIYPLTVIPADYIWATQMGWDMAARVGFGKVSARYRGDLGFTTHTYKLGPKHSVLLEIGDHSPCVEHAVFLKRYARFLGLHGMRSFLVALGKTINDGSIPLDIECPPGKEYWHTGEVGEVVPVYTRLLKLKPKPYMHGEDVEWVQDVLIRLGYLAAGQDDGIYGPDTAAAVLKFQKAVFTDPAQWDSKVGPATWAKLGSV
jgi:hypothetical protein